MACSDRKNFTEEFMVNKAKGLSVDFLLFQNNHALRHKSVLDNERVME